MITGWCCYILRNKINGHTYNGMTNNIDRRIRQHNGEIAGGAIATRKNRPWEMYCIISGFKNMKEAMRAEWRIRRIKGRKRPKIYCGPEGRIKGLKWCLLNLDKWTKQCDSNICDEELTLHICEDLYIFVNDLNMLQVRTLN